MAAGAIPPPLFFERRHSASIFAPENGTLEIRFEKHTNVDHTI
jgi:hypothetical protein